MIRLTGSRSKLSFAPLPSDDPLQRQPRIELARDVLGWQPRIQLEEGLTKTIAYFDRLLGEAAGLQATAASAPQHLAPAAVSVAKHLTPRAKARRAAQA